MNGAVLRIEFTDEDLAKVRVASEPDYLWETSNSVQTLRRRDGSAAFGDWRGFARGRIVGQTPFLSVLLPSRGYSPDFLTPSVSEPSTPEIAIDALLRTPRRRLRADLGRLSASPRVLPSWVSRLADGDPHTLSQLGRALETYHQQAVAPIWPSVRAHIDADRMMRMRDILDGGVTGLLSGLGPHVRWAPPVLEVDYPFGRTLHLEGRGILLQPSYFCWPTPVTLADPALPPVLVYPARRPTAESPSGKGDPLAALIGRTRAAILRTAQTGSTPGELARLLGITLPAVSQQTAVLRQAGLLVTLRRNGHAHHITTAEGRALLHQAGGTFKGPEEPPVSES